MTEFQIATLELQWWSIYVAAGVGILQCALIVCWIFIIYMELKRTSIILANQEKMLDTIEQTNEG